MPPYAFGGGQDTPNSKMDLGFGSPGPSERAHNVPSDPITGEEG